MYKKLMLLLTLFLSATLLVSAQDTSGRIVGTVNAADGVIPGATVVVTDNQTKKSQTLTSGENGSFTVSLLEFGTYTVKISAQGYKTFIATDIKIDAGRERALNAVLEVGTISEEVTVTGSAGEAINATNGELSTTISQEQIRELPLNTRNPLGLLNLIAGANPTTSSINGQRSSSTDFRRDGLNVQDNFIRTGSFVSDQPTVDDTSEFSVTTQNAGVDQGGGSSLVQLVTPRGGNQYHGALYEFNRNSVFAANSFVNNERALPRPFLNRNQFGGSFSGPLPFFNFGENNGPLFRKDKSFFFFNYEGFRLAQQVTATGTTLLPQARNGTFTFTNLAGAQQTVNVLTGTGFSSPLTTGPTGQGGVLPVDPIIQARVLNGLPTTANGITTGTNYLQTTSFLRSDPLTRNSFTGRGDYDFNDRNSFNLVYRYNNQQDARTDTAAGFQTIPFVFQGGPTHFWAGAFRTTPTSNFSNEIRGGYQSSAPFFQESGIPSDYLIGGLPVTSPEASFRSQGRTTDYRNIQDNAVYTRGNHSFRFGGQAEFYKIQSVNLLGITPTYNITTTANTNTPGLTAAQICGTTTCINATELARANTLRYFLGGIIGAGSRTSNLISPTAGYGFGPDVQDVDYDIYSAYGSDQWRLRPNFTLNLGLRYEYYTPLHTPVARYLEPVIVNGDIAGSTTNPNGTLNVIGTNSGTPGNFTIGDKDNFSPSVSFAWSPKSENGLISKLTGREFVIRGGARVNYINDEYVKAPLTLSAGNRGLGAFVISARDANGLTTVRSSLSPLPTFVPLPQFTTLPTVEPLPLTYERFRALGSTSSQLFGVDPKLQLGRVLEWNFGIQREIGFNSVIEIRYVGNMSNDLIRTTDYNQIDVLKNGFLADFKKGQSNLSIYDAQFANCRLTQTATQCTTSLGVRSAGFNAAFAGSQQLPVLTQTTGGGATLLTNPTFLTQFEQGGAGAAAQLLITNNLRGNVVFQPNPNILISEIVSNAGKQRYNALQAEIRRRFSNGFSYQVNYTFQKTLTDVPDDSQNRQGELQEGDNSALNYGRPDYDRTHTLNANMIWELPFGKGKRFLNDGGWTNAVLGGFQFTSIVNISSGPPLGVVDPRGTKSIAFVSGRQSATTTLSPSEVKKLTGVFDTPNGRYFIDPRVLNATITNSTTGETRTGFDLSTQLPSGFALTSVRAASPFGQAPFAGQVFFFNKAGETGNLPRNFVNGLPFINWDAGLSKNFRFGESMRLQIRGEMFNVLNKQVPNFGADLNINSDTFGRITGTFNAPRVVQFGARFDF